MKKEKLYEAIGEIDDNYINDAHLTTKRKSRPTWIKWGAMAACLCLVVLVAMPFMRNSEPATDIEPYKGLSVSEAIAYEHYGELFPQTILDGYVLEENTVGLYDGKVMKAVYYNNSTEDVMTITISDKGYFENVELNTVLETGKNGSKIYIASGDYVVCYSFSIRDINTLEGFYQMVTSATAFDFEPSA
jgi:hypothetical protein